MTLIGLDLNATRARAVSGPPGLAPRPLLLAGTEPDLPMALSLQERRPAVGRAGIGLCREYPHLVCRDFLAQLGSPRTWAGGRHRLDSARALTLVFDHLRPLLTPATDLSLALPSYLSQAQAMQVLALAHKAKLPVGDAVAAPLAIARAAHGDQLWSGTAVLVDADDHALGWTALRADKQQIQVVDAGSLPQLNLQTWKACLLDAIAAWCIRHSRRDPRDSGAAEQLLFDQLDDVFEADQNDQMVEVIIRTGTWCQNLILQPEQIRAFGASLVEQAIEEIGNAVGESLPDGIAGLLVTPPAARLPGLVPALQETVGARVPLRFVPADAAALAAHELAVSRQHRSGMPHDFMDRSIPLSTGAVQTPAGTTSARTVSRYASDR